ncbi:Cytosolic non-specific dipeptidase [Orchesella cincta]|uniref:Cytosolic non-specific dipeptidase n=1 Tax=Orchesella cincta TaxID=48709 RepID=A0A1D2MTW8_ORCCI|nr:Cytosolic non-specific dipeptidase [Orchesella cincta]
MEEVGSEGLEEMLISLKDTFLKDVDVVTISDNYWIGTQTPCLTYGLRGLSYFSVEVECGTKDLHSGVFGGAVHEALPDLIWLLDQLVDVKGTIQIPGVMDDVLKLTEERADSTTTLISIPKLSKTRLEFGPWSLLRSWSEDSDPSQSHWKVFHSVGRQPGPDKIGKIVKSYLETKWEQRGSPNKMVVSMGHGGRPFISDYNHPNYVAAVKATEFVYGVKPIMTRSGGSIPITIVFQEVTGKNVMLLPMGQADDGAHSQNEKISKRNYIEGTKLFVTICWSWELY